MGYTIEWIGENAIVTFEGELTINEVIDANGSLIGHANFDNLAFQLWDFTDVKIMNVDSNDMRVISTLDKGASYWNRFVKVAIVAVGLEASALAKEYIVAMKITNWTCREFNNFDNALEWCMST